MTHLGGQPPSYSPKTKWKTSNLGYPRGVGLRKTMYPPVTRGLTCWLDASTPSSIYLETGVSHWDDKSGSGSGFYQSTSGAAQPGFYTKMHRGFWLPDFDGTDDVGFIANHTISRPMSVAWCGSYESNPAGSNTIFSCTGQPLCMGLYDTGYRVWDNGAGGSGRNWATNVLPAPKPWPSMNIYILSFTTSTVDGLGNGGPNVRAITTATNQFNGAQMELGRYSGGGQFDGPWAELLVYWGTTLTRLEMVQLGNYLRTKWGTV